MSKTVWFDVTDFIEWNGFMTGVQRVVFETVTRACHDDAIDARLFRYNSAHKDVEEVNYDAVFASPSDAQPDDDGRMSRKEILKRRLIKLRDDLPPALRQHVTLERQAYIKRHGKKLYVSLAKGRRVAHDMVKRNVTETHFSPATIRKDDTVVVIGKLWDYPQFVELLGEMKKQIGFHYIQLIHDIIPVYQRHLFGDGLFEPFTDFLFEAMSSCDEIIAISQSTENDINRFIDELHFPAPPIRRIQLGDTPEIEGEPVRPDFVRDGPFILSVGTVEARKNHILLYETYKLAAERGVRLPRLLVVGARGWLSENMVYMATHDADTKDLITFHSGIADAELKWLYQNCLFTAYPSVYEGWGLPVRESFTYGKPCITTKRSSLAEAGGKYATYVSGYDPSEMLDAINKVMSDVGIAERVAGYAPHTWDETYVQFAGIIRR